MQNKKVYSFHLVFRDKHINELLTQRSTVCNSSFIRKLIYDELSKRKLKFTKEVVGHGAYRYSKNTRYPWYNINPKLGFRNLMNGSYDYNTELKRFLEIAGIYNKYHPNDKLNVEEFDKLFDESVNKQEKYKLFTKFHSIFDDYKFPPFANPRKTIVKITVQNK